MNAKTLFVILPCLILSLGCQNEVGSTDKGTPNETTKVVNQIVEASCGICQLEMEGDACDLAVRINGQNYYVDGSSIDDHGDAHGADGMCNCIRQAKVTGEIKDGRFAATSFEVLPQTGEKK